MKGPRTPELIAAYERALAAQRHRAFWHAVEAARSPQRPRVARDVLRLLYVRRP